MTLSHSPSSPPGDAPPCQPLEGLHIVSLALNLPGPLAASRLYKLGAKVTKIEPPTGDPFANFSQDWYAVLSKGQSVLTLNLKAPAGRASLDNLLAEADLLLTSNRPAALARLELDWMRLHTAYPQLCQVAILGHAVPDENRPGHDLNYQSEFGLLTPPHLPRVLIADLAGAERAVSAALALLLARQSGREGRYAEISLAEVARDFAAPLRYGLTTPGGFLGGGFSGYNLYRTADGWITLAAVETHFWERCTHELGLSPSARQEDMARAFAIHPTAHWQAWAVEHDLPLAVVHEP
jgi:alpha-methylacyl-CoA racemase